MDCLQTGKGHLQPNDAFGTPSVVKYGTGASNLSMTATGTAQARRCLACTALPVHSAYYMATALEGGAIQSLPSDLDCPQSERQSCHLLL